MKSVNDGKFVASCPWLRRVIGRASAVAAALLIAAAPGAVPQDGFGSAVPVAHAHDAVIGGNVSTGQVLDAFPREIKLEFSGIPKEGFNTFAVTNRDTGEILFDAIPQINGRFLSIAVPEGVHPGPGHYQVGFLITSSDGHATRGGIPFDVGSAAASTSDAATAVASPGEQVALPLKLLLGLGSLLAVVALIVMVVAKNRRK